MTAAGARRFGNVIAGNGEVDITSQHIIYMGIDIYARWPEQDAEARQAQIDAWSSIDAGDMGYIREAYHGDPYPSRYLVSEAFDYPEGVAIPAAILRDRLPETVRLAAERERTVYGNSKTEDIALATRQYRAFVALCEKVEKEREATDHHRIVVIKGVPQVRDFCAWACPTPGFADPSGLLARGMD